MTDLNTKVVRTFECKVIVKKSVHVRLEHFLEQQRQKYNPWSFRKSTSWLRFSEKPNSPGLSPEELPL